MSFDPTSVEVRWTPAEVRSIYAAALRDLAAGDSAVSNPAAQRDCAMVDCDHVADGPPLVVDVPAMPGPFAVDLCDPCRHPFESGMESVERLLDGDTEAAPHRFDGRHAAEREAER